MKNDEDGSNASQPARQVQLRACGCSSSCMSCLLQPVRTLPCSLLRRQLLETSLSNFNHAAKLYAAMAAAPKVPKSKLPAGALSEAGTQLAGHQLSMVAACGRFRCVSCRHVQAVHSILKPVMIKALWHLLLVTAKYRAAYGGVAHRPHSTQCSVSSPVPADHCITAQRTPQNRLADENTLSCPRIF